MQDDTIFQARLLATSLATPRFRGRARLIRLAQHSEEALRALELSPKEREIAALKGELPYNIINILKLPSVQQARDIRAKRDKKPIDLLSKRKTNNVKRRALLRAFKNALYTASFRTATHSHKTTIDIVEPGNEYAESVIGSVHPSKVGLPNAYCRVGFRVSTSHHIFSISVNLFCALKEKHVSKGIIYLSQTVRVRQGRGSSLVCEQLDGRRWVRV